MNEHPGLVRTSSNWFLFIYLVRQVRDGSSAYCTVVTCGRDIDAAERVAMRRMTQQGLEVLRPDTATRAPWLDPVSDGPYLAELARCGSALQLSTPGTSAVPPVVAAAAATQAPAESAVATAA